MASPAPAEPLRLCIIGGSPSHPGGLETFCTHALEAFRRHVPGVHAELFPTESAYIHVQGPKRMTACIHAMIRRRREFDFAWVQASNLTECCFVLLARLLGWTVLVTPHFGSTSRLETRGWVRWLRLTILARAHGIGLLFDGQDTEISLPRSVPRHVVGTFLPTQAFAAPAPATEDKGPLRLIHAARFSEAKGSLLVVDLCARLKRGGVPFSACLVGRGDSAIMDEINRRIAEAGMAGEVTLVDWLDADGIAKALRDADVLVHLSSIDSFPLIVLEALAAGTLPLVRPMAGSLSMVRTLGGHCVGEGRKIGADGSDPVEDAFRWLAAADIEALRQEGGRAGERTRSAYRWEEVVRAGLNALAAITPLKR